MSKYKIFIISAQYMNQRLDKWCFVNIPNLQNSLFNKYLRKGYIKVNNKKVHNKYLLQLDDKVCIPLHLYLEKPSATDENQRNKRTKLTQERIKTHQHTIKALKQHLLYKDANLLAINKPAGLSVQGGSKVNFSIADAVSELRYELTENPKIVHRLDKDTSGILLLARTNVAAHYVFNLFKNKLIKKSYICIVKMEQDIPDCGVIDQPLLKQFNCYNEKVMISPHGRAAITHYEVVFRYDSYAVVLVQPITGRTHQIRVHMSEYLKAPIVGDWKYGFKHLDKTKFKNILYLHAFKLEFPDISGINKVLVAPYSSIFSNTFTNINYDNRV